MRLTKSAIIIAALMIPAIAQASPSLKGSYGDWKVYTRYDGAQQLCYVVSDPKTKSPSTVRHGDIHFLVASWKSGAASEQPSFMADFSLRKDDPPTIQIDKKKFSMFASENEGFIAENSDEKSLINEMRAGSNMRVRAVSGRGTKVSYSFSLKGVTAALKKAQESCA